MSLIALLEKPSTSRKYDKVEHAWRQLSSDLQGALRALIDNPSYAAKDIAAALTSEGHQVNASQVSYFRRKVAENGWPELAA